MKKHLLTCMFIAAILPAAFTQVTFVVDSLPEYTPAGDILYIAGDFQGWDPGNPAYALEKNENDKWSITLPAEPEGTVLEFKFTRGDWGKVEKGINGEEIQNRIFTYGNGDTVSVVIYNWADFGGGGNSTAADNVSTIDSVYMPQLDRYRRIWVYLPPDYESTTMHYPVIYMHDGQNLFDSFTSFAGEWEVDETLNDLYDQGYAVPIVIGIDNGGTERINEYTPWPNSQYGGGMGNEYMQFIVETLKPQIDMQFRTLPEPGNTGLWGSSLGGLISNYGALKYPDVFGKAGLFSPSYWFSDEIWTFTAQMGYHDGMRIYQMAGSLEGGSMTENLLTMHDTLTYFGYGDNELETKIITGGQHNEAFWSSEFEEAYLWLFQSWASAIDENVTLEKIRVFPNPVRSTLNIPELINGSDFSFMINDLSGREIIIQDQIRGAEINVAGLKPGCYLIQIESAGKNYVGKFIKSDVD